MPDATTRALAYALASIESRRLPTLDEAIAYREEKWQRHMYEAERILAEGEWLAEHDREVAEKAWDDGFDAGYDHTLVANAVKHADRDLRLNPHRLSDDVAPGGAS